MTFTLRLFIMGLVTFLPSDDGRIMTILLQNATDHIFASDGSEIHSHLPVLVFERRNVRVRQDHWRRSLLSPFDIWKLLGLDRLEVIESRRLRVQARGTGPDCSSKDVRDRDILCAVRVWDLRGEKITVENGGASPRGPEKLSGRRNGPFGLPAALPENRQEGLDFSWVPAMPRISDRSADLERDILTRPSERFLKAYLELDQGLFQTFSLVDTCGFVRAFRFKPARKAIPRPVLLQQAVADIVLVEIPVAGCSITISTSDFQGRPTGRVRLGPRFCSGPPRQVDVLLGNLSTEFGNDPDRIVQHFERYYEIAERRWGRTRRPSPYWNENGPRIEASKVEAPENEIPRVIRAVSFAHRDLTSHPNFVTVLDEKCESNDGGYNRPICTTGEFQSQ
ncbi:MAG TPA: hypothetical protein VF756_24275 [Thermoanaerobaculia bacterium]